MSWFNNLNLLPKLIALFTVIGVLPLAIVGWMARDQSSAELQDGASQSVSELAFNASDKLDRNLFERYGDVQAFALSDPARSMDPLRLNEWMNTMMGTYTPIYTLMIVADAKGRIVATNTVDLEGKPLASLALLGKDISSEAWFKGATNGSLQPGQTLVEDLHEDSLATAVFGAGSKGRALSFTYPIKGANGEVIGVWTNRFNWDVTLDVLNSVIERAAANGMTTARIVVVDSAGKVVASQEDGDILKLDLSSHPVVGKALGEGASGASEGAALDGTGRANLLGYYHSSGFSLYPGLGWGVVATQDRSEALAAAGSLTRLILAVGFIAAIAIVAVAVVLARRLRAPVLEVVSSLESLRANALTELQRGITALAQGDLSVHVAVEPLVIANPSTDEVGRSAAAVNQISAQLSQTVSSYEAARASLSSLIGEVQENASGIRVAADQLSEASGQMAEATGQIATTITEVTRSAISLSEVAQGSARDVERLSGGAQQMASAAESNSAGATHSRDAAEAISLNVREVATSSSEVLRSAQVSRTTAQEGRRAVARAVTSMESIAGAVESAKAAVDRMGDYGQQIGEIVKVIDDIASQTNLLALNAAIEAARAGDQGRGFAVVADNVRALAERSSASAQEIADLVSRVQAGTREAVTAMAAGVADVANGRSITVEADSALESIISSVDETAVRMQEISGQVQDLAVNAGQILQTTQDIAARSADAVTDAQEMAQGTQRVSEAIVQVSATTEETSASAEQVSASTEELAAQSEELSATAALVRERARRLDEATLRFVL